MERDKGDPESPGNFEGDVDRTGKKIVWQREARRSNFITILLIIVITAWAFLATWFEPWTRLRILGLVLYLVSAILVVVARLQLGASFTTRAEARNLVTKGLYSRIQNPIYLFASIAGAGLILFVDKPWYFLTFLVVIPVQVVRIRRERKILAEHFGQRYERYRQQTWF
jgi:protein-S-isoprenylcysteine O-methyltransferase Ste14